jgi:hypothetical protein
METLDAYSYYAGLGVAIIVGYILSSLRLERLLIALILLPERVSGQSAKKQIAVAEGDITDVGEAFSATTSLSGWTDENIFELERRAIFSKACNFNA